MQIDSDELQRSFPWVKELWLRSGAVPPHPQSSLDVLVVSTLPPRNVRQAQRKRLLAELQARTSQRIDIRLTTSEQLARWLQRGGRFASTFRKQAVMLFQRPSQQP